jgi:tetratricopeptide (TPR) repeat protein
MRYAAFLLLLCACSSLSSEQQDQLALHQRNAKYYFDGGRIDQAVGQIERGLELDPDDYLLLSLKGSILLKQSASALGQDHRRLDEATEVLTKVYETRSANRHEPYLLLNYALAQQKQGRRHLGESLSLRDQATRAPEKQELLNRADAAQEQAAARLGEAREVLGVLVDRGELLRIAHYHLLLIAQDLRDDVAFDIHEKAYLKQLQKDQTFLTNEIEHTAVAAYEQKRIQDLENLKNEELEVRGLLAEHNYMKRNFENALTMLNRVLELDPSRSVDYYNRGRVLLELQRNEDASKDFKTFLATTALPDDNPKKSFAFAAVRQ